MKQPGSSRQAEEKEGNQMEYSDHEEIEEEEEEHDEKEEEVSFAEPAVERVNRGHMLKIVDNFNAVLGKATKGKRYNTTDKSNAANILLATSKPSKGQESLIEAALKLLNKAKVVEVATCATSKKDSSDKPSTSKRQVARHDDVSHKKREEEDTAEQTKFEKKEERREKKKTSTSFSKILNESSIELGSPPDSPDPPKRLYSLEEIQNMMGQMRSRTDRYKGEDDKPEKPPIKKVRMQKSTEIDKSPDISLPEIDKPVKYSEADVSEMMVKIKTLSESQFSTSTPAKPHSQFQSKSPASSFGNISQEEAPSPIPPKKPPSKIVGRKKALFSEEDQIKPPDMHQEIIEAQLDLSTAISAIWKKETESMTRVMTDNIRKQAEEISMAVKDTMFKEAREMAHTISENLLRNGEDISTDMAKNMKDFSKGLMERHEETSDAITTVDEQLTNLIMKKNINLISGLQNITDAVMRSSQKMAASQENMVSGMVNMAEALTKMSGSMANLTDTTSSLSSSVHMAGQALKVMVTNLEKLTVAQADINVAVLHTQKELGDKDNQSTVNVERSSRQAAVSLEKMVTALENLVSKLSLEKEPTREVTLKSTINKKPAAVTQEDEKKTVVSVQVDLNTGNEEKVQPDSSPIPSTSAFQTHRITSAGKFRISDLYLVLMKYSK